MKNIFSIAPLFAALVAVPLFSQTVQVGDIAPDFMGSTIKSKYFDLHDTLQDSITVIYFMGFSCGICKGHAPAFDLNIHQKYRRFGIKVIAVDVWDGTESQLNSIFIQPTGSTFDFIPMSSGIGFLYGLGVHSFVVVGLDKKIKYVARNYDQAALSATLDVLTSTPGEKPHVVPFEFYLEQNYPNPFNPSTRIDFQVRVSQPSQAELIVYDLTGRRIKTLFSQAVYNGFYSVEWNGRDERGEDVPSGLYIYSLNLPDSREAKRMLLIR